MVGGPQHQQDLEAQIAETLDLLRRTDGKGYLPLVLLERAGLERLRGDLDVRRKKISFANV